MSLLGTIAVLVAAPSGASVDLGALAAQRDAVTVAAATPAAPADSADTAADVGDVDEGTVPDEVVTLDGGSGSDTVVEETAPVDEEQEADTGDDVPVEEPEADEPEPTKIRHVFVITLAGHGFEATFGAGSPATYLNVTLRPKGALLSSYRSLGTADLPDHVAAIGGQPPNADTRAGCPTFREIPPTAKVSRDGVVDGDGCVYPNTVTTIGDQLSASRRTWRAYVEDIEKGPAPAGIPTTSCRHPESGGPDDTLKGRVGDGYATRHNPFVYFHSLLDLGDCQSSDGALTELERDLRTVEDTPNYSYIVPNLCNDGTESPCVDGSPGGLAAADAFLATWVPKILASPAYKADGLLIVTFAGSAPPPVPVPTPADPAAAAPTTPTPTTTTTTPAPAAEEPVLNGALLVSRFAQAGTTVASDYNPYSLLRAAEDLFALRPLAKAADAKSFAPTVLADAYVEPPSDG
jgi:hypothetical protein